MSRRSSGGVASSDDSPWSGDPLIGRVLDGRYRIEDVLGTGGVGVVYRAEHLKLRHQVAIKVLHDQLGGIDELRIRFQREGQALSALSHPNIVAINDYGIHDGMPYLVMELLVGRTLADLIDDDGPPSADVVLDIMRQVLRGLSFAHDRGIVHRDLKAANVFLVALPDAPHHAKILDFGLAKIFSTEDGDADPTLTKSGTILGTPAYMAPEQASGSPVDERADVYSAGVLLFEMLAGRYPFQAATRADMLRAHMLEPLPELEEARPGLTIVPELRALVRKAMAKERVNRFSDAGAMLAAVEALPSGNIAGYRRPAPSARSPRVESSSRDQEETVPASSGGVGERASEPSAVEESGPAPSGPRFGLVAVGFATALVLLIVAAFFTSKAGLGDVEGGTAIAPDEAPPEASEGEGAESTEISLPPEMNISVSPSPAEEAESSPVVSDGEDGDSILEPLTEPSEGGDGDAPEPDFEPDMVFEEAEEGSEPEDVEASVPDEVATDEPEVTTDEPEAVPRDPHAPRDPFLEPMPTALRRLHRRVFRGANLSNRDVRSLRQLQRTLPEDARPSLVLAHYYVDKRYFRDALSWYQRATDIDPTVRGDRRMLPDLLRMAASQVTSEHAMRLVVTVFGREAIDPVRAELRTSENPELIGALTRLEERLGELP
ncbi:MAG: protein kinase [Myxococcota bacterium]